MHVKTDKELYVYKRGYASLYSIIFCLVNRYKQSSCCRRIWSSTQLTFEVDLSAELSRALNSFLNLNTTVVTSNRIKKIFTLHNFICITLRVKVDVKNKITAIQYIFKILKLFILLQDGS